VLVRKQLLQKPCRRIGAVSPSRESRSEGLLAAGGRVLGPEDSAGRRLRKRESRDRFKVGLQGIG